MARKTKQKGFSRKAWEHNASIHSEVLYFLAERYDRVYRIAAEKRCIYKIMDSTPTIYVEFIYDNDGFTIKSINLMQKGIKSDKILITRAIKNKSAIKYIVSWCLREVAKYCVED